MTMNAFCVKHYTKSRSSQTLELLDNINFYTEAQNTSWNNLDYNIGIDRVIKVMIKVS